MISTKSKKDKKKYNVIRYFDRKHIVLYLFGIVYIVFFANLLFWNNLSYIGTWFLLFISLLIWWLEFNYEDFRKRDIIKIIGIILVGGIWISLVSNAYIWLWYLTLNLGIIYALYSCFWYKNGYRKFYLWDYALYGLMHLSYFLWFGVGFLVIGNYKIVDFNCEKIYSYFSELTSVFDKKDWFPTTQSIPSTQSESNSLSNEHLAKIVNQINVRPDQMKATITSRDPQVLEGINTTDYIKNKRIKLKDTFIRYKNEFINDIVTQRKIVNQEFCYITVNQINILYQSDGIKLWVIAFMGLFLYPFFMILFYIYGIIWWVVLKVLFVFKVWRYKKQTQEITSVG